MELLERKLDSFVANERKKALGELMQKAEAGQIELPAAGAEINLHCHTFFSYNTYGYSPSKYAWLARKKGLGLAGIVDFDVLDGLEEFLQALRLLNLKGFAGLETRVFVPEFAEKEMTSPGEPGITYHMGVGFPTAALTGPAEQFLRNLKQTAQQRNIALMERVNSYLAPLELDYEKDVLPLTPAGNPTERHLCSAYARKAAALFGAGDKLVEFWSEKLGQPVATMELPEGRDILNLIRAKTMKRGGAGYVQPDSGSFPRMDRTNEFILSAGAIPTLTWLNGLSDGEQAIEELLEIAMSTGVTALNIIPDRNFTPGVRDNMVANLYHIVEVCEKRHLPIVVGTEMNSPGQKFVDDFHTHELKKLLPVFRKGAHIVYAHSIMQQETGLGYTSEWAKEHFPDTGDRNQFYEKIGQKVSPVAQHKLSAFDQNTGPDEILKAIE